MLINIIGFVIGRVLGELGVPRLIAILIVIAICVIAAIFSNDDHSGYEFED